MLPSLEEIKSPYVDDDEIRSLVAHHTACFAQHEQAWKQHLPPAIIHNDANDYNVIVLILIKLGIITSTPLSISATLMCYHFARGRLAITIVMPYNMPRVWNAFKNVWRPSWKPIKPPQIMRRWCVSCRPNPSTFESKCLNGDARLSQESGERYILISQRCASFIVRQFAELGDDRLQQLITAFSITNKTSNNSAASHHHPGTTPTTIAPIPQRSPQEIIDLRRRHLNP